MANSRDLALEILRGDQVVVLAVTKELMDSGAPGDLGVLVDVAKEEGLLPRLLGRIVLMFPEYDSDPREVFEVPECRDWIVGIQEPIPFLALLAHPQMTFQLLMLCEVPWRRSDDGEIVPDANASMGWMLDCGMTSYEFATWLGHPAPKKFTASFLGAIGLGPIVNDDLLEDYARTYAAEPE